MSRDAARGMHQQHQTATSQFGSDSCMVATSDTDKIILQLLHDVQALIRDIYGLHNKLVVVNETSSTVTAAGVVGINTNTSNEASLNDIISELSTYSCCPDGTASSYCCYAIPLSALYNEVKDGVRFLPKESKKGSNQPNRG